MPRSIEREACGEEEEEENVKEQMEEKASSGRAVTFFAPCRQATLGYAGPHASQVSLLSNWRTNLALAGRRDETYAIPRRPDADFHMWTNGSRNTRGLQIGVTRLGKCTIKGVHCLVRAGGCGVSLKGNTALWKHCSAGADAGAPR